MSDIFDKEFLRFLKYKLFCIGAISLIVLIPILHYHYFEDDKNAVSICCCDNKE